MGSTLSDGMKIAITMIICVAIIAVVVLVYMIVMHFNDSAATITNPTFTDHLDDFVTMSVYGEAIPVPNVVAALEMYGTPETFCLQLEDLKGEMGGTPYPMATNQDMYLMNQLLSELKKHYDMEVYVYTATPNGYLQLCVSELPHSENIDGADQWD